MLQIQRLLSRSGLRQRPFHQTRGGQHRQALACVKSAVRLLSGGAEAALLAELLASPSYAAITAQLSERFQAPVLQAIQRAHALAPDHFKPTFLSLVAPHFSTQLLSSAFGFQASTRSFATARRHARVRGAGALPPKPQLPPRRQPLTPTEQQELRRFLLAHSQPSAYLTCKLTKNKSAPAVPVQLLEEDVKALHERWVRENHQPRMTYDCFRKQVKALRQFKKGRKQTDMCEICVHGKAQTHRLTSMLNQHTQTCENSQRLLRELAVQPSVTSPTLLSF